MKCPKCGEELRRSKKDPHYGLCDNCRKKFKWVDDYDEDDYEEDDKYIERKPAKRKVQNSSGAKSHSKRKKKKSSGMVIGIVIALAVLLVAVAIVFFFVKGRDKEEEKEPQPQEPTNTQEQVNVPAEPESSVYFKDDVLKIDMATIRLTGFEVAPPNQTFGEEKSTLIITYEFTNDSDDVMQPGTAWIACFNATQETDTTIDSLNVAMAPQDEKYTEMNNMSFTDVKPGATVSSVISYEINDTTKPITLKATQGVAGVDLGEKVYNLQ